LPCVQKDKLAPTVAKENFRGCVTRCAEDTSIRYITVRAADMCVVTSAARRIDSMRVSTLLLIFEPGLRYFEVSLQDNRGFDFGECEVKDKAVCVLKHGSVIRFHKLSE